jgi:hypothetical protein
MADGALHPAQEARATRASLSEQTTRPSRPPIAVVIRKIPDNIERGKTDMAPEKPQVAA